MHLQNEILKTLLYYDIWSYPLTADEIFTFLPVNSITPQHLADELRVAPTTGAIAQHQGFYFVADQQPAIVAERQRREEHARRMWKFARISTHIIKRFPFVRGVFVSGELSKNATHPESDIDFFILTEPDRLWIARTLLIVFKKTVLLNSKKYFCLNSFTTTDNLRLEEHNLFLASEVATLKPLFNTALFYRYINENRWINSYFPNFDIGRISLPAVNNRKSWLQKLWELPFSLFDATRLDSYIMGRMEKVWQRRYPEFDEETHKRIFKCTRNESRAYVGNFERKILGKYNQRLRDYGVMDRKS